MAKGFAARVSRMVTQADLVLEVIDARFPDETRNSALENRVVAMGKKLVIVVNKSDLVSKGKASRIRKRLAKQFPVVFASAKERRGKKRLLAAIGRTIKERNAKVAIVGYPNSGKSSLINLLKGRKAARTSKRAGFTRGEQIIRVSEKISVIDSPGVIPMEEWNEFRLFLVGAKNPQDVQDKELAATKLIEFLARENPAALRKRYGIGKVETGEKTLGEIALGRKKLRRGGGPDTETMARIVLEEWGKNILS